MDILNQFTGSTVRVWGRNPAVSNTAAELLYQNSIAIDLRTVFDAAYKLQVTSGTTGGTADTGAGTGAQKVRIVGLDASLNLISEDVTLNGQNYVETIKSFKRVFAADVCQAGTGNANAGNIYVIKTGTGGALTTGTPATLTSCVVMIPVGENTSCAAHFTAPAGTSYRLKSIVLTNTTQAATVYVYVTDTASATDKTMHPVGIYDLPANTLPFVLDSTMFEPIVLSPGQEISVWAKAAVSGAVTTAQLVLSKNSF